MPSRIARSSLPQKSAQNSGNKRKSQDRRDRNLDAFAIAQEQNPDAAKFRKHRLATTDFDRDEPRRKRQRTSDDEDSQDDDSDDDQQQQRGPKTRDYDGLEAESGSDSEGNEWHFGFDAAAGDEDEDIDSDEAFGESDDERFEDYTFRGSSGNKPTGGKSRAAMIRKADVDLDENDGNAGQEDDGDESDGSLGSDAVDLATMLDNPQDSDEEAGPPSGNRGRDEGADSESSSENEDDEDDYNPAKLAQLRSMVDTLEKADRSIDDDDEDDEADLKPGALLAAMQRVADGNKKPSRKERRDKTKTADGPLAAPMAKRQQDELNRKAAYGKAKETLGRWQDTVKHNREADHLIFPLADPTANEAVGTSRMAPTSTSKPHNALENTIEGILQESGLATAPRKGDDADGDELPANKPSLKNVKARRAELRRARELLFREEQRAKRVKKIKSKAYRRVHRRERERADEQARTLMGADGEGSESERERNDRRRAEERMGARHRESRWARQAKKTGQLAWNEDARAGVEDMARRDEELRRRIQGREPSGSDGSEGDDANSSDDDEGFKLRTQQQLDDLEQSNTDAKSSRLASLKFMERAEAARKKQTDDAIRELRRDIAGDEGSASESEDAEPAGRRTYGPAATAKQAKKPKTKQNEFEEGTPSASEAEDADDDGAGERVEPAAPVAVQQPDEWTTASKARKHGAKTPAGKPKAGTAAQLETSTTAAAPSTTPTDAAKKSSKPKSKKTAQHDTTLAHPSSDAEEDDENDDTVSATKDDKTNASLIAAAFAPDDEAGPSFAAEKRALAASEAPQRKTTSLPGWNGAWSGAGLSNKGARQRQRRRDAAHKQSLSSRKAPAETKKRDDAEKPSVILSARQSKKSARLLASAVPFPYASGAQYEAGLRVPVGREWNAAGVVAERTMPRVVVRRGIVEPMERPL